MNNWNNTLQNVMYLSRHLICCLNEYFYNRMVFKSNQKRLVMTHQTVLHDTHVACNAKMVDFHGWQMPIHYGSQIEEHHAVRQDAGMFDVSHMTIVDVQGPQAQDYLRYLLANDVIKLKGAG